MSTLPVNHTTERRWLAGYLCFAAAVLAIRLLVLWLSPYGLYLEEPYYWLWSKDLDWGYFSKPPLMAAWIALTGAVFGDSVIAVKSGSLLLYPITGLLLFLLGQRLHSSRAGFWCAVLFQTLPGISFSGLIISTDVLFLFCWSGSLLFWVRALADNRWRNWIGLGVFVGLGLLSKYTMVLWGVSALLFIAITPAYRPQFLNPRLYAAAAIGFALLSPNLVWNYLHHFPTVEHTVDISNARAHRIRLGKMFEFVGAQAGIFGPVGFIVALGLLLKFRAQSALWNLLLCFSLPMLLVISGVAALGKANANWAAPVFVALTIAVTVWALDRRWKLLLLLLPNLALGAAYYAFYANGGLPFVQFKPERHPFRPILGWDAWSAQLASLAQGYPHDKLLSPSREVLAWAGYLNHYQPADLVAFQPIEGKMLSQFDLVTPIYREPQAQSYLFISEYGLPELSRYFEQVVIIGEFERHIIGDLSQSYQAAWVQGYRQPQEQSE